MPFRAFVMEAVILPVGNTVAPEAITYRLRHPRNYCMAFRTFIFEAAIASGSVLERLHIAQGGEHTEGGTLFLLSLKLDGCTTSKLDFDGEGVPLVLFACVSVSIRIMLYHEWFPTPAHLVLICLKISHDEGVECYRRRYSELVVIMISEWIRLKAETESVQIEDRLQVVKPRLSITNTFAVTDSDQGNQ
ncbi:hypothetical protein BDR04DRAFT_1112692 [Suillus decipiens]|nr:hypothetical protein BDR04DRAFT_1112692 [Suillus decipiens]